MLGRFTNRVRDDQRGFTLIELLVVILIIGILAAIALPAFLGQRAKGQDGEAKSNARNLVSHIESCYTQKQAYTNCVTAAALNPTGLDIGTGGGQVTAQSDTAQTYVVTSTSRSGNTFTITKNADGTSDRACSTTGGTTNGGCDGSSW
jgi:type IV pilus assembly protein PilA